MSTTRSTGYSITDEQAGVIDGLVAKLKKKDAELGETLESYFIFQGMNISRTADWRKISRTKAQTILMAGVAWMDAKLYDDELPLVA